MYELRPEGLDFLGSAPVIHVFEGDVAAPRKAVFALVADTASWAQWFPGFRRGSYGAPPETGTQVGMPRSIVIGPGVRIEEHVAAWDEPERYAYGVERTSVPMANALVEAWDLTEIDVPGSPGGGTRVKWTFAIDPKWPMRLTTPLAPPVLGFLFRKALRKLEAAAQAG
ncbi:MAG: SRPBCC family protein [Acidimicrobiia bacterium]|nr:SRPBCC family protein [Acidimicrobiia bacterium]